MIEKIKYKKDLYAIIIRSKYRKKKGISFFTPDKLSLQCGFMKHKKNYVIKPHLHQKRSNKVFYTSETLIILKGRIRIDFYNTKKNYLLSKILRAFDIIVLIKGGHGFKILSNCEMIEVKQGPYMFSKDKEKFHMEKIKKLKIK
tara:strand:- start:3419 stop:3850 length:432 start_codon:yes stop_codon:yes gene_type:complete